MLNYILQLFNSKKILYIFILTIISLSAGFGFQYYSIKSLDMDYYTDELSKAVKNQENEVTNIFFNGSFVLNAVEKNSNIDSLKNYERKKYTLLIFDDKDSLVYWNNNKAELYKGDIISADTFIYQQYRLQNSYYLLIKAPYKPVLNGKAIDYTLVALIPIYEQYSINNEYVQDKFSLTNSDWTNYIQVSDQPTPYFVSARDGRPLLYLKSKSNIFIKQTAAWAMFFYFAGSTLGLICLYLVCCQFAFSVGLVLMLAVLTLARWLTFIFQFPAVAKEFEFFNKPFTDLPHWWSNSLGEFLLETAMLFFVAVFVYKELRLAHFRNWSKQSRVYYGLGIYNIIALQITAIVALIENIVKDSYISFSFDNVSNIEFSSFLSVGGITILFIAALLSNYRFLQLFFYFKFNVKTNLSLLAFTVLIQFLILSFFGIELFISFLIFVFAVAFILLLKLFIAVNKLNLVWITIWILYFGIFSTVFFQINSFRANDYHQKEFIQALASERDNYLEENFTNLDSLVAQDDFFSTFFNSAFISRKQTVERLKYRYLDKLFFGRYNYNISVFNSDSSQHRSEFKDYSEFSFFIDKSRTIQANKLFHYSEPEKRYTYFAKIEVKNPQNKLQGFFIIEFIPKTAANRANILVEVLKMPRLPKEKLANDYQYALYKSDRIVYQYQSNSPAFLPYNLVTPSPNSYLEISIAEEKYLAYRHENNNLAIIKLSFSSFGQSLTVFAYLFCTALIVFGILGLMLWLWGCFAATPLLILELEISLRERIQRGIVLVSFFSFVTIAVVTVIYFRNEYNSYHENNLKARLADAAKFASLKVQSQFDDKSPFPLASELAELIQLDVNVYNISGSLLSSSSENVFEQKLISKVINPIALHKFNIEQEQQFILTERIGNFQYYSAYFLLKDDCDSPLAYINLSYDSEASNTVRAQEVAQFLGALLNVYVLFLLLAGAAGIFIAQSVSRPLTIIADKMKSVKLGATNEPLDWKVNDELGALVKRYNQMLVDLEHSKGELEISQRESAWRDMARQVAHEVKNPLTPMKLGIQFLQKLFYLDPEKAKAKLEKTIQDILLQIDNLSHIASEFSNFAKMPEANNQRIELSEICEAVFALFTSEQSDVLKLYLQIPTEKYYVFADKNQLLRVFNNLFKNAIQSIETEVIGEVILQLYSENNKVVVAIYDNGCGIPAELRKNIFVPNFTTKSSGSGIGLAMCKQIIEMAKGKIYFEPRVPQGTTFKIELPLIK